MTKYPNARFAVISDLHFYDTSLGCEGSAFENEMDLDRKMLIESEELLDYTIENLLESDIQFLLVCGDLTKDGEALNHKRLSAKLQVLAEHGIKVIVTPGNHDINNFSAVEFSGEIKSSVESISSEDFKEIYAKMGFEDSLMSDDSSLSYVSEPVPGLWVIAIDACRYDENRADGIPSVVGGAIKKGTEQWLKNVLSQARENGKAVIALLHHGVVEHWDGQARLHPDCLLKDYNRIGRLLASNNVSFVFTGHNHAQNIARADFSGNILHDVGTGSLVTYPCPVRHCNISNNRITIVTQTIADKLNTTSDFSDIAKGVIKKSVAVTSISDLRGYRVSDSDAEYIAKELGEAFVAHYSGDANKESRQKFELNKLTLWGKFIFAIQQRYVIDPLWKSASQRNNHTVISLKPELAGEKYWGVEEFLSRVRRFSAEWTFERKEVEL